MSTLELAQVSVRGARGSRKLLPAGRQAECVSGRKHVFTERKGKNKQGGKGSQHFPLKERKTIQGMRRSKQEELLCRLLARSYCFALLDAKAPLLCLPLVMVSENCLLRKDLEVTQYNQNLTTPSTPL